MRWSKRFANACCQAGNDEMYEATASCPAESSVVAARLLPSASAVSPRPAEGVRAVIDLSERCFLFMSMHHRFGRAVGRCSVDGSNGLCRSWWLHTERDDLKPTKALAVRTEVDSRDPAAS